MTHKTNYVYLLQISECIKMDENIYKIGMTRQENLKRFAQYPKGSILLFQMVCIDCHAIEKEIMQLFKQTFIQQKNYGNEYFRGNYHTMIEIMYHVIEDERIAHSKKNIQKRTPPPSYMPQVPQQAPPVSYMPQSYTPQVIIDLSTEKMVYESDDMVMMELC